MAEINVKADYRVYGDNGLLDFEFSADYYNAALAIDGVDKADRRYHFRDVKWAVRWCANWETLVRPIEFKKDGDLYRIKLDEALPQFQGESRLVVLQNLFSYCRDEEAKFAIDVAKHKRWYSEKKARYFEVIGAYYTDILYKDEGDGETKYHRAVDEWINFFVKA